MPFYSFPPSKFITASRPKSMLRKMPYIPSRISTALSALLLIEFIGVRLSCVFEIAQADVL
jgi:hypothetical protein